MLEGAEPFLLPGGRNGVLLLHGFTGAPAEMRLLGEELQRHGYTVLAPRLAGHGTQVADLARSTWQDWYYSAQDGYWLLQGMCDRIAVIGQSMGALLAMELAANFAVAAIALLSPAVEARDSRLHWIGWYRFIRSAIPRPRKNFGDLDPRLVVNYDRMPTQGLYSLYQLMCRAREMAGKLQIPVWIGQPRRDHTVQPEGAERLYHWLPEGDKELVWFERSGHILTLDQEREKVFRLLCDFIAARVGGEEGAGDGR